MMGTFGFKQARHQPRLNLSTFFEIEFDYLGGFASVMYVLLWLELKKCC